MKRYAMREHELSSVAVLLWLIGFAVVSMLAFML